MKRNLLVLVVVSVVGLFLYSTLQGQTNRFADKSIKGKITFTKGTVLVNNKSARKGQTLKYGDRITTKGNSSCVFKVGGKNVFKIKSNSNITFRFGPKKSSIRVNKGTVLGVMKGKKLFKNQFSVNTPTAVAGIRGTTFALKVEDPNSVYFCTCNGSISLSDKDGKNKSIDTNSHHGAKRFIQQDNGSIKVETLGLEYHTDEEMEELAKGIDESINWSSPSK